MSNTPPPPPFGQPGPAGQPVQPLGYTAAPAWQSGSTGTGGLTEGPGPAATKSKTPMIIAIVVVIIAIAVVLFFVLGGDDESGGGAINAAGARAGLEAFAAADDEFQENDFSTFSRCPMTSVDDLLAELAESGVDVPDELLSGRDDNILSTFEDSIVVFCTQSPDDGEEGGDGLANLGITAIAEPPSNFARFLEDIEADSEDPIEFDELGAHAGGELFVGCDDAECTAAWYHPEDEIAFALTVASDDPDADQAAEFLKRFLPRMAAGLADQVDESADEDD